VSSIFLGIIPSVRFFWKGIFPLKTEELLCKSSLLYFLFKLFSYISIKKSSYLKKCLANILVRGCSIKGEGCEESRLRRKQRHISQHVVKLWNFLQQGLVEQGKKKKKSKENLNHKDSWIWRCISRSGDPWAAKHCRVEECFVEKLYHFLLLLPTGRFWTQTYKMLGWVNPWPSHHYSHFHIRFTHSLILMTEFLTS